MIWAVKEVIIWTKLEIDSGRRMNDHKAKKLSIKKRLLLFLFPMCHLFPSEVCTSFEKVASRYITSMKIAHIRLYASFTWWITKTSWRLRDCEILALNSDGHIVVIWRIRLDRSKKKLWILEICYSSQLVCAIQSKPLKKEFKSTLIQFAPSDIDQSRFYSACVVEALTHLLTYKARKCLLSTRNDWITFSYFWVDDFIFRLCIEIWGRTT